MPPRVEHLFTFFTPGAVIRSTAGLVAFAVRHPRLFMQLLLEGFRDRKAFVRLIRLPLDVETIRNSPLFDREWYVSNHAELAKSRLSPELHCLLDRSPGERRTSPRFSCEEYLSLNPEVRAVGIHPLVHYEQYGRFIGCPASALDANPPNPVFPDGACDREIDFDAVPCNHARTAVFATFSPDGRIAEKDIFYIRGLREVCDNIVVAVNAPLFPAEVEKLRGVASAVICRWHGGYDFGSYRIGLDFARERGWLAPAVCRELVFANSSCYAPVLPFSGMFQAMERRRADFWGITFNTQRSGAPHLQSFFLVFRRPVLDADALEAFFAARPERATRNEAIDLYEIQLTAFLRDRGFVPDAFVRPLLPRLHEYNPTTRPLDLIRRHKVPLVKVKALLQGESSQSPERILALVRRLNPDLADVIASARRRR